ncbi:hypothetical protein Pla52n_01810 [Stieleria varia]|uniref:Uncharacterized protein n=1 Tax=Stieleria varia TaxID=2528005 RepID=A0A5C6B6M8_9BACT|nr:hypothetical protein Pla52n_01810 [Stieleria varia]
MIKSVLHPKSASLLKQRIDTTSGKSLPGFTLAKHFLIIGKRDQQVSMIRHHDRLRERISKAKGEEADNACLTPVRKSPFKHGEVSRWIKKVELFHRPNLADPPTTNQSTATVLDRSHRAERRRSRRSGRVKPSRRCLDWRRLQPSRRPPTEQASSSEAGCCGHLD